MDEKKKKSLSDELLSDDFFKPPSEDIFGTPAPQKPRKGAPKKPGFQRKSLSEELGEDFLKLPSGPSLTEGPGEGMPPDLEETLPPPSSPAPSVRAAARIPSVSGTGMALALGLGIAALLAVTGGGAFYWLVLRTPPQEGTVAGTPPPPPKPSSPEAPRIPVSPPPQAAPPPQQSPPPQPAPSALQAAKPMEPARPALPPPVVEPKALTPPKPRFTLYLGEFTAENDFSRARKTAEESGLDVKVSKSTAKTETYFLVIDKAGTPEEANAVALKLSILGEAAKAEGVSVRVGPYKTLMDALTSKGKLASVGYSTRPDLSSKSTTTYRLSGGKFVTKEEARDVLSSLSKKGLTGRIVPLGK